VTRVEWRRNASFERFARALDVPSENIVAVIPRGGHDEEELYQVFFTIPEFDKADAADVLLGPERTNWKETANDLISGDKERIERHLPDLHGPALEERSSRRMLVGFFDDLAQDLDRRYRTRDRG
jgi:hypothetical protein